MNAASRAHAAWELAKMKVFGTGGNGMKRWTFGIGLLAALSIILAGCGSTTGTTAATTVTLNITAATVAVSSSQQFIASIVGPTDTSAIWEVNSVVGGDSTHGTISTTGLYTAPSTVPSPNTVTVTAVSNGDKSVSASATVTIDSGIRVAVTPITASVGTGETFPLVATVSGTSITTVKWTVCQVNSATTTACVADTTGALGTIDAFGNYKAPATVPAANPVTVQAASTADVNQVAGSVITLSAAVDPTVTSIYPTQITQGSFYVDVWVTGANFLSTTTVLVNGGSLTPGNLQALNSSTIRARIASNAISSQVGSLTITVEREGGSPISCAPTPSLCQLAVVPGRPAIVAANPNSATQTAPGVISVTNDFQFNLDGGYFGTNALASTPATVLGHFDGNTVSTNINNARSVTVNIKNSDFSLPGLHQVTLTNPLVTTPAILPQTFAAMNFAVQSCVGAAEGCGGNPSVSIASLPVGTAPRAIAVNTATGIAVVANFGSNSISLIDLTAPTPTVTATIPVGAGPTGVAVDNVRNLAVVTNNTDKTISVVNLATKAVTVVSTQIPAAPISVGVNPITGIALVAYQSTNVGALVDLTQTPPVFVGVATVGTGTRPQVAIVPTLNWGLITPGGGGSLSILDLSRRGTSTIASTGAVRVSSTNTVTITTTAPPGVTVGDAVLVTGVTDTSFNGVFVVATVPSSNSFTYTQIGPNSSSGGGTIYFSEPLANVNIGENVTGISVNPESKRAILTDPSTTESIFTMSILDQTISTLNTETGPLFSATNPYTDIAVTINPATNQLSVIDARTPSRLATLNLPGTTPGAVAIDPGTDTVLVANQGSNDVTVISLGSIKPLHLEQVLLPLNRQLSTDLTLASPTDLSLTLVGKGFNSSSVARVDGFILSPVGTVTDREMNVVVPGTLLANPRRFAVDVLNTATNAGLSNVEYFSVVKAVDLTTSGCPSPQPSAVAVDDLRNFAMVTETTCAQAAVVNLGTGAITNLIPVGNNPQGVATAPGFGLAVVTNRGDNTATIIDTADFTQATNLVSVGGQPIGVAISPIDGTTFVANSDVNSSSVASFGAADIPNLVVNFTGTRGANPVALAVDPIDQIVLVANAGGNTVTALDMTQTPPTIKSTAPVLSQPTSVAFDSSTLNFIVAASTNNALYVLNPTTETTNAARVGIGPTAVAFNYLTNTAVTVNSASNTVSVMDMTTQNVRANLSLGGAFLGSVAIVPNTNLCLIVDQLNNRLLMVPLPN
jgi:YVTN family beta-propeller protein